MIEATATEDRTPRIALSIRHPFVIGGDPRSISMPLFDSEAVMNKKLNKESHVMSLSFHSI